MEYVPNYEILNQRWDEALENGYHVEIIQGGIQIQETGETIVVEPLEDEEQ